MEREEKASEKEEKGNKEKQIGVGKTIFIGCVSLNSAYACQCGLVVRPYTWDYQEIINPSE